MENDTMKQITDRLEQLEARAPQVELPPSLVALMDKVEVINLKRLGITQADYDAMTFDSSAERIEFLAS